MTWDFAEANRFGTSTGNVSDSVEYEAKAVERAPAGAGVVDQVDAAARSFHDLTVSTDLPYDDNIGYPDLSDFFYVWLRRSLRSVYPELLGTMLTPKSAELVATPYVFGGSKQRAEERFEAGFRTVFRHAAEQGRSDTPMTIFYAFKQSEAEDDGASSASTGWEKMLQGLVDNDLVVTGTWPMRTELGNRMRNMGSNALASSIVLVCRARPASAGVTDRRGFLQQLKAKLGNAVPTFDGLRRLDPAEVPAERAVAMLVVDEAHYVKNPAAKRSQAVAQWGASSRRVLLLTGTPIENRIEEFQALIGYLQPELASRSTSQRRSPAQPCSKPPSRRSTYGGTRWMSSTSSRR
jgi:putative DNA methylase